MLGGVLWERGGHGSVVAVRLQLQLGAVLGSQNVGFARVWCVLWEHKCMTNLGCRKRRGIFSK